LLWPLSSETSEIAIGSGLVSILICVITFILIGVLNYIEKLNGVLFVIMITIALLLQIIVLKISSSSLENSKYCVCDNKTSQLHNELKFHALFEKDLCDCEVIRYVKLSSVEFGYANEKHLNFYKRFRTLDGVTQRIDLKVPFNVIYTEELKGKMLLEHDGSTTKYIQKIFDEIYDEISKTILDGNHTMDSAKSAMQQSVRTVFARNQYVELTELLTMQECVIN